MPMRFAVPPVLAAVLLALTSMPALADPSAADLAKATQAIAALSAYDWSVGDADELVRRVVTASSADSLQTLARGGEKRAETLLGIALAYGAGGFVADDDVSVKMLKAAADQNFPSAQVMLGFMYESGRGGLVRDLRQAANLYEKAADQGDAGGQLYLGDMYYAGVGGRPRDRDKALKLFQQSAAQGDKQAIQKLLALGKADRT